VLYSGEKQVFKSERSDKLHWTEEKEQVTSDKPVKLLIDLINHLPSPVVNSLVFPVGFFYLLCSPRARKETRLYQKQMIAYTHGTAIKKPDSLRQIISFSLCVLEKIEGWSGKINLDSICFQNDDIDALRGQLEQGKGAYLICSHLGNVEMLRSLASFNRTGVTHHVPVVAVMDVKATQNFTNALSERMPGSSFNLVDASSIGPDTIEILSDCIDNGGLVVVAADRTSPTARDRTISRDFLGKKALFPYGTFLLASLLDAPVYYVFALRQKDLTLYPEYNMYVNKADVSFDCPRNERENRIHELCGGFAERLEEYCIKYPYQWYNFYNFWAEPEKVPGQQ
jgi:predicted LPLAT superfamily acyltransferase